MVNENPHYQDTGMSRRDLFWRGGAVVAGTAFAARTGLLGVLFGATQAEARSSILSVINPDTADDLLDPMKGKRVGIVTSTASCPPCRDLESKLSQQSGFGTDWGAFELDMDDLSYLKMVPREWCECPGGNGIWVPGCTPENMECTMIDFPDGFSQTYYDFCGGMGISQSTAESFGDHVPQLVVVDYSASLRRWQQVVHYAHPLDQWSSIQRELIHHS